MGVSYNDSDAGTAYQGTDDSDTINGNGGNDTINTLGGDDQINGNMGDDVLYGTTGNKVVRGGKGNDNLNFGNGNDTLFGDEGVDFIVAGNGNNVIFGGTGLVDDLDGADTISTGSGNDALYGDFGDDYISAGAGNDFIQGGMGADTIFGGANDDQLYGQKGNDLLIGGTGFDFISGGDGYDIAEINGRAGNFAITTDANGNTFVRNKSTNNVTTVDASTEEIRIGNGLNGNVQKVVYTDLPTDTTTTTPGPTVYQRETVTQNFDNTVNAKGTDGDGHQLFGNGNGAQHVSTENLSPDGTQNYLRAHDRGQDATQGPIRIDEDGVPVYAVDAGMQTATRTNASFDYGLITGLGGTNGTVDGVTSSILIDGDLSQGTDYITYVKQQEVAGHDAAYLIAGTNEGFGGDETGQGTQVSENSANLGFASIANHINGGGYQGEDGLIDVIYRQTDTFGHAEDNHIRLQVGTGMAATP